MKNLAIKNAKIYYFWKCTNENKEIRETLWTIRNANIQSLKQKLLLVKGAKRIKA